MSDCVECVVSQLVWNNTLIYVLANQGLPDNTTVGMYRISLDLTHCGSQSLPTATSLIRLWHTVLESAVVSQKLYTYFHV